MSDSKPRATWKSNTDLLVLGKPVLADYVLSN